MYLRYRPRYKYTRLEDQGNTTIIEWSVAHINGTLFPARIQAAVWQIGYFAPFYHRATMPPLAIPRIYRNEMALPIGDIAHGLCE
jgi:hypothetical protein